MKIVTCSIKPEYFGRDQTLAAIYVSFDSNCSSLKLDFFNLVWNEVFKGTKRQYGKDIPKSWHKEDIIGNEWLEFSFYSFEEINSQFLKSSIEPI